MAAIHAIRSLHLRGWSERRSARELRIARETVHKFVMAPEVQPRYRLRQPRRQPVLDQVKGLIDQWLAADEQAPPKQRHTAHCLWERRTQPPYNCTIGESTVRLYVRQQRAKRPEAFVPLAFGFGHAQADWGAAEVVVGSVRQTGIFFVLRLDASEDAVVQIFPTQRTEAIYEGHRRAFEFFGAVPPTILYDNAPTLVAHVLRGRDRTETAGFLALRAHYGFAADSCQPGLKGAHEKGGVENGVGWARRNLLVPVPQAESWEALNAELVRRCQERRRKPHSREEGTLGDWAARERPHLLPLPTVPLACCQVTPVRVNRYAMVSYDRVRYSVPTRHVGRMLLLKAFVERIEVTDGESVVAVHARAYTRKTEVLAAEHYVELLAHKPSAVAHARVFRALSEPYASLRAWCLAQRPPATREFVAVLRLWHEFPAQTVAAALQQSMAVGVYRAAAVRQLCLRARPEDAVPPPLVGPWTTVTPPPPDLTHFDRLLSARQVCR